MRQKRVRPSRLRESTNQHLITSFEEYQLNGMAKTLYALKNPHEVRKEHALPDIDAERDILNLSPLLMTQLDKGWQQSRRQIVDTEIPAIFEALERMRFP
jgi:hypothetical protein